MAGVKVNPAKTGSASGRRVKRLRVKDAGEMSWRVLARPISRRLTRHARRYMEVLDIIRRYDLHHILAELDMGKYHLSGAGSVPHHVVARSEQRADNFASALEELGPCFIKLGQLMSTRPDLLPQSYIRALSRLQNRIQPVPSDEVVRIVERELQAPISEIFADFDRQPVATASMAQVHRATLPDGTQVAVKVQRPGVKARTEADLEILHEVLRFGQRRFSSPMLRNLHQMVRELEEGLIGDMDFMEEAVNTRRIKKQLSEYERLATPEVFMDYTTSNVMTMSFVRGRNLSRLTRDEIVSIEGPAIADELLAAYLKQIVVDGIFHCDPHPGNILVTEEGQLVLLDFGMVGRFDAEEQERIIQMLLAFSERQGERVADLYLNMVDVPHHFDTRAFKQDVSSFVSRYHDISGGRMGLGTMFLDLVRIAEEHDSPVPSWLTLLSKALLNLDGIVSVLSPELDPVELIRSYMWRVMQKRMSSEARPGKQISWALDLWRLMENAPRRADLLMHKLANDQLTLRVEINRIEESAQQISHAANRLSRSIIVGSAVIALGYVLGSRNRGKRLF